MKKLILLIILSIIYLQAPAQLFFEAGGRFGQGLYEMNEHVPFSGGWHVAAYYSIKDSPLSVGLSQGFSRYGYLMKEEQPFARDGLGEDVATITNRHSYNITGLHLRYSPKQFRYSALSPFVSIGVGHARHKTTWKATNYMPDYCPEDDDNHDNTYSDTVSRSSTIVGMGEVGVNWRLIWAGDYDEYKRNSRLGLYLTLSAIIEHGGRVNYFNSKFNEAHFTYDSGLPPTPARGETVADSTSGPTPLSTRHQTVQLKATLTVMF